MGGWAAVPPLTLLVSRHNTLEDSSVQLAGRPPELVRNLAVQFANEPGVGAGVMREFWGVLCSDATSKARGLFCRAGEGSRSFRVAERLSWSQPDKALFRAFGTLIGIAIKTHQLLPLQMTPRMLAMMLQRPRGAMLSLTDGLEELDPQLYRSLQWILQCEESIEDLDLTFSVDTLDCSGVCVSVELCEGGAQIAVDDSNKKQYVEQMVNTKLQLWEPALAELRSGVHNVIALEMLEPFTPSELELLLSGLPTIDVADWKEHCEYRACSIDSSECQWFWDIVERMTEEQRALVLQFSTGTSRVPIGGFAELQGYSGPQLFTITLRPISDLQDSSQRGVLPTSSTCFNMLKLPRCNSYDDLETRLHVVVRHGCEGFSFS